MNLQDKVNEGSDQSSEKEAKGRVGLPRIPQGGIVSGIIDRELTANELKRIEERLYAGLFEQKKYSPPRSKEQDKYFMIF